MEGCKKMMAQKYYQTFEDRRIENCKTETKNIQVTIRDGSHKYPL